MAAENEKLLDLAAKLSDGASIDWDSEERDAMSEPLRREIRHLRLVADVQRVHTTSDAVPLSSSELLGMTSTIDADSLNRAGTESEPPDSSIPQTWGHLEIREKLGVGGFGEVYRAWDPNLEREVALKLLKPWISRDDARAKAALKEGRMLARVRHPNVITVYGAETHDGRIGLWMEFVRGRTLSQIATEQGRFGAREAALIGLELCRALAAVHGAGLVHRDVKTDNAMRDEDGRFLLMDFGAGEEAEVLEAADAKTISGTPLYIAPEIYLGEPATPGSDIYSLGVLLYFLVTGSYPVTGASVREIKDKHLKRNVKLLRDERADLPEAFVQVIERSLARDPQERFATAGQMELALSSSLGVESGSTPLDVVPASKVFPGVVRATLAAVALVAVLVAGWLVSRSLDGPVPSAVPAGGTVATVAAVSPSAYSVKAALYRLRDGTRERIDAGDTLRVGDELTLELEASRALYVYIFNEDERGNAFALFPLPALDLQNPLPANETHVLPGSRNGSTFRWQVSSAGEREHLVALASPDPLDEFEEEMRRLALPTLDSIAVAVPPAAHARLRGIGGLTESTDPGPEPTTTRLFEMAQRLSGQTETVEGVWMREIELENPGD